GRTLAGVVAGKGAAMDEGEGQDVAVDTGSSTGTESAESTSQATTQPAQTGQTQQTVPYDRFQQVIRQVQEYRPLVAQVPQLQQQLKEAQDRLSTCWKKARPGPTQH